ncbi:MAG: S-layer homology domain-containing protein [Acidimicrobiia bacterium]|nr:S-layer homology domain-containing protein [Acidimicrobiia bacterium]
MHTTNRGAEQREHRPRRRRAALVVVMALMASLLAEGVAPAPAGAQGWDPMEGLSPDGGSFSSNPVFSWDPVPGYDRRYRIQIADNPGFSGTIVNTRTYNTSYTPTAELPLGTIYWRVRADESGGNDYEEAQFEKSQVAGPTLVGPANGATLQFPVQPPEFSWTPVPGVRSYRFELSESPTFVSPQSWVVQTTAAVLISTQEKNQTFYWRVRGASNANGTGVLTEWSQTRNYSVEWDTVGQPQLVSPPSSTSFANAISDVALEWSPVLGAKDYQLEVSVNEDFSGSPVATSTQVGTRWQPNNTLDNGQYWWRVRARDISNRVGPWSGTFAFVRNWPQSPSLVSPSNGEQFAQPERYRWDPVPRASHYEVQVAADPGFSVEVDTCFTNQTDVSAENRRQGSASLPGNCRVFGRNFGETLYWRVRGIDAPSGVLGLWSSTRTVSRNIGAVQLVAPPNGATMVAPVLEWTPMQGVRDYRVTIVRPNGSTRTENTLQTTYVPSTVSGLSEGDTYQWYVIGRMPDGKFTPVPPMGAWRSFTLAPPPSTSSTPMPISPADGAASRYMPAMLWEPVTGADRYEVRYRTVGAVTEFVLDDGLRLPGLTYDGMLPAGNYEWRVIARNGSTFISETDFLRGFTVQQLNEPTFPYTGPPDCPPGGGCSPLTSTPTLEWEPIERAGGYVVWVATDENFTNVYARYEVPSHRVTPRESYADNDAGQAYFWHVQPCKTHDFQNCTVPPQGQVNPTRQAFQKRSDGVVPVSPAAGASVPNQPTFTWQPFLGSASSSYDVRNYRIEVSTVPSFSSLLDSAVVDQPFYTPRSSTYPEGPLYWRVRGIDNSNNSLTWSPVRTFTKASPELVMQTPEDGETIDGAPNFAWEPQAYSTRYHLEVYRKVGGAQGPSVINLNDLNYPSWIPTQALGAGDYMWRVRRRDASNNFGPWTDFREFTISGYAPLLLSPAEGIVVQNDELVFTWDTVPQAGSYRWQLSASPTFAGIEESQETVMTAWAPTSRVSQGDWWWRVEALTPSGESMGTSAPRKFTRDSSVMPTAPRNLSVNASGGVLDISWQAPSNVGDPPLTGYRVTLSPGGHERTVNANTASARFTELINGTSYSISVVALVPTGQGPAATANAAPPGCVGTSFSDVPGGNPFCTEIAWLAATGITTGTTMPNGSIEYRPAAPVSRMAMAAFLYRFDGEPAVGLTEPFFADVPQSHPFYTPIQWMAESGLSTGTPQGDGQKPLYKPNDEVSRQAMGAFLYRFAGEEPVFLTEQFFADVLQNHPFYTPIQWMAQTGLSTGTEQGFGLKPLYKPVDPVSRQAMAAFLFRFDDYLQG